ncbi:CDP-alcohol phosphatidyltransferase [Agrobacterium tumefaciens]|nr:CDP-alcohol phosphatidyltransferase [Agrobacterium tumefaciens]NTE26374.1 CDP-alcohol phosphatidyltransferase [Agrobacterium tumefaciens]
MKDITTERVQIFADRKRTNILRTGEQQFIHFLLKKIPGFISPNIMTGVGMFGSVIVCAAFLLGANFGSVFLPIGIIGLFINWFGDSLDGRLAYYRGIARKWYGFALDIIMDWLSIILIGMGYYFYATDSTRILGFIFVVCYGWSMIISLLRYKILGVYRIDAGLLGPTELRVIIAIILLLETVIPGSITYSALITTVILLVINIKDTNALLELGNDRDRKEREIKP